jgi:serine/threonine-protein kinase
MICPSCNSPLEPNARFCGVCGYRLHATRPSPLQGSSPALATGASGARKPAPSPVAGARTIPADGNSAGVALRPAGAPGAQKAPAAGPAQRTPGQAQPRLKSKPKPEDIYLNQVLNNRFRVESKIGEGGFGAVYRGVQLATGRKVALKLLHPEMTKDDNLVARFRREGMVLCNLRDAHTITTYDFDQTPDGTLYIAMELLEGKSLHQLFHEQAPLEWRRMFKILTEMCSSLAEAHAQGIVHRDLKPENVYLESRPGNPEFVKILDFGIAKVMRGDTIDPQSPQLTATGQTLGTLEYMSPEQLMGKPLDGRSDVYALGVVAYEMITGRLPFPDAKGPAGLITAQLKQTPVPPSAANPKVQLPTAADRVILKCLEKDKNNRYTDVTHLSVALQEVLTEHATLTPVPPADRATPPASRTSPPDALELRRPEAPKAPLQPQLQPMPLSASDSQPLPHPGAAIGAMRPAPIGATPLPMGQGRATPEPPTQPLAATPIPGTLAPPSIPYSSPGGAPYHAGPAHAGPNHGHAPGGAALAPLQGGYPQAAPYPQGMPYPQAPRRSIAWVWWLFGLLVLGAGFGALVAVLIS